MNLDRTFASLSYDYGWVSVCMAFVQNCKKKNKQKKQKHNYELCPTVTDLCVVVFILFIYFSKAGFIV